MTDEQLQKVLSSNKKLIILGSVFMVTVVAAIIVLIAIFKKRDTPDLADFKALMAAKDETIRVLQQAQATITRLHDESISVAQAADKRDSVLIQKFANNQVVYKTLNQQYEQVPQINNRLRSNIDSLLQSIADY